jgi:hypothetical protein
MTMRKVIHSPLGLVSIEPGIMPERSAVALKNRLAQARSARRANQARFREQWICVIMLFRAKAIDS